jgi:hypothetical protein
MKLFTKMYQDLVMTNYFMFKYNTKSSEMEIDLIEEDLLFGLEMPN